MLKVEQEEERIPLASLAFAMTEGFVLMNALGFDTHIASALKGIGEARLTVLAEQSKEEKVQPRR